MSGALHNLILSLGRWGEYFTKWEKRTLKHRVTRPRSRVPYQESQELNLYWSNSQSLSFVHCAGGLQKCSSPVPDSLCNVICMFPICYVIAHPPKVRTLRPPGGGWENCDLSQVTRLVERARRCPSHRPSASCLFIQVQFSWAPHDLIMCCFHKQCS